MKKSRKRQKSYLKINIKRLIKLLEKDIKESDKKLERLNTLGRM